MHSLYIHISFLFCFNAWYYVFTYDANTGPIFKKLELLKFHDIHLFQLGFLCFLLRTLHSLLSSITFSLWKVKSIIIILGMPILFACLCVEQTPDCFRFISKVQSFKILWIPSYLVRPHLHPLNENLKNFCLVCVSEFCMAKIRLFVKYIYGWVGVCMCSCVYLKV